MTRQDFTELLIGKDLRRVRQNGIVVNSVRDQKTFDELFGLTLHHERAVAMRAVDAIEKITLKHPEYLSIHKNQLLSILKGADHKELKWHIAQLIPRIDLTPDERTDVWNILAYWALNRNESKIVRVNALQGLFDLKKHKPLFEEKFGNVVSAMDRERIPSIQARIRKLKRNKTR